ncbi:PEP/pyruvate-binding domain-containing protein [Enhygromyxa salina]|uniref:Phosphoenolpyruvate synthase n=1 Tax=Enhygromyxa salina TaxID=215803 RepID=A0A2S9XP11_9BACT|nr:PEP/pyruvate-binding domain-containing protein [Enhygromyxa salina]PRP94598.1 phosphoenolpyruvate synthase [Enhygromyxa salina]
MHPPPPAPLPLLAGIAASLALGACGEPEPTWTCVLDPEVEVDYSQTLGCRADYERLATLPTSSTKSAAITGKTVFDSFDGQLYFQDTSKYPIHWDFAFEHLSGSGSPIVPQLSSFNETEYYAPSRRFLLGALTYYAGPAVYTYEISPYDTMSAAQIQGSYEQIAAATWIGEELYFHPTSEAIELEAEKLPDSVKIITTDELYAGQQFQILNTGETYAKLIFRTAAELETSYVTFRDVVVLDAVPNDISVVSGIITAEFQTPLSHINVLSQNRGTPNLGLREAYTHETLRPLEDKWVRFQVTPERWEIEEVTQAEADAWWEANRPEMLGVPAKDLSVTEITDIEDVLDPALSVAEAIDEAIPAFGGKASNFAVLPLIGPELNPPKAFAIPVYFHDQFLVENGFDLRIEQMLADDTFTGDAATRDQMLKALRDDMRAAPLNLEFMAALTTKLEAEYPGVRMRFRSSTNAEDLDGFTGAGLYTSASGSLGSLDEPIEDAIREVWASVWYFRAFEEREYRSIEHTAVGMALLCHNSFPDEEANGVALTANIFDQTGAEPGFYINVQEGEASVVSPAPGVTTDELIYHFTFPGQPVVFVTHSNLVPAGENVLTNAELYALGTALAKIHSFFADVYEPNEDGWYAMDVEFKFDDVETLAEPVLWIKQARPHPGLGN